MKLCAAGSFALPLLAALAGCHGYYANWHYAPRYEVHTIHVVEHGAAEKSAEPRAIVGVRIVGILRPENDGPRRLHTRFEVENPGTDLLTFKTNATRVTPTNANALEPESANDVLVVSRARRTIDVYFALPDPALVPNEALTDLVLSWSIDVAGSLYGGRADFHLAWPGDWGWGGYDDDPFWYDRPYWYGGPRWSLHGGMTVIR